MEQRSEEWYEARRGKLTASRIGRLLAGPSTVSALLDAIQREVDEGPGGWLEGRDADSPAMAHGRETEDRAVALYEMLYGVETVKVGLIDHPTLRGVAASCDRIQVCDATWLATVEAKCPINPDVHAKTLLYGMPREHYPQVQTQIACAGMPLGYFMSFNASFEGKQQLYVEKVLLDNEFHAKLYSKVAWFWNMFDRGERPTSEAAGIPKFF